MPTDHPQLPDARRPQAKRDATAFLADAYDQAQANRGDDRRAYRGG